MSPLLQKIPENSACVIIGPPLEGKRELLYSYASDALKNKLPVAFITTDSSAEDIKKELLKNKIFYGASNGLMMFIDCYSQQMGSMLNNTNDTVRVPGPLALNEISIALSDVERTFYRVSPKHMIIFDSLSTLLMYSNPQMVGRFVQVLIAKIRQAGGSVIFTLEEGMHEQSVITTIEHLMTAIIHVKKEGSSVVVETSGLN